MPKVVIVVDLHITLCAFSQYLCPWDNRGGHTHTPDVGNLWWGTSQREWEGRSDYPGSELTLNWEPEWFWDIQIKYHDDFNVCILPQRRFGYMAYRHSHPENQPQNFENCTVETLTYYHMGI